MDQEIIIKCDAAVLKDECKGWPEDEREERKEFWLWLYIF